MIVVIGVKGILVVIWKRGMMLIVVSIFGWGILVVRSVRMVGLRMGINVLKYLMNKLLLIVKNIQNNLLNILKFNAINVKRDIGLEKLLIEVLYVNNVLLLLLVVLVIAL